ncbi:MAG: helix-turn-helix domain-containing protein [Terriglobales bacterium]
MKEALEALIADMVDKGILLDEARTEFERRFIRQVLERAHGNRSQAAQILGLHRNTLSRKLDDLNGSRAQPRQTRRKQRRSGSGASSSRRK